MPVTNYYSVKGRILSEATVGGGGVRAYGRDALGSVVATYDTNGLKENVYHFKPYGAQASKTGTAADPKFTWVGSLGYRQTGLSFADLYVRARHYASRLVRWTTADPQWPAGPAFAYPNPVLLSDPSGLLGLVRSCTSLEVIKLAPPTCSFRRNRDGSWAVKAFVKVSMTANVQSLTNPGNGCDIHQWYKESEVADNETIRNDIAWQDDGSQVCWAALPMPARSGLVAWTYRGIDMPGLYAEGTYNDDCQYPTADFDGSVADYVVDKISFFTCCNCPGPGSPYYQYCQQYVQWSISIVIHPSTGSCSVR